MWNPLNGSSLTSWFTETYVSGTAYGLDNPNVDGFFLDDTWRGGSPSEQAWPCSKRGTGAGRCAGLTSAQRSEMVPAWRSNMDAVETAIVEHDGFAWQNFYCIDGSSDGIACRSSTPSIFSPFCGACSAFLRASCQN